MWKQESIVRIDSCLPPNSLLAASPAVGSSTSPAQTTSQYTASQPCTQSLIQHVEIFVTSTGSVPQRPFGRRIQGTGLSGCFALSDYRSVQEHVKLGPLPVSPHPLLVSHFQHIHLALRRILNKVCMFPALLLPCNSPHAHSVPGVGSSPPSCPRECGAPGRPFPHPVVHG